MLVAGLAGLAGLAGCSSSDYTGEAQTFVACVVDRARSLAPSHRLPEEAAGAAVNACYAERDLLKSKISNSGVPSVDAYRSLAIIENQAEDQAYQAVLGSGMQVRR